MITVTHDLGTYYSRPTTIVTSTSTRADPTQTVYEACGDNNSTIMALLPMRMQADHDS